MVLKSSFEWLYPDVNVDCLVKADYISPNMSSPFSVNLNIFPCFASGLTHSINPKSSNCLNVLETNLLLLRLFDFLSGYNTALTSSMFQFSRPISTYNLWIILQVSSETNPFSNASLISSNESVKKKWDRVEWNPYF